VEEVLFLFKRRNSREKQGERMRKKRGKKKKGKREREKVGERESYDVGPLQWNCFRAFA
jgi:hypothetical protein